MTAKAPFVPHGDVEVEAMLAFLGLGSTEELFSHIPESIRLKRPLALPPALSEADVVSRFEALCDANRFGRELICFAGGGAYDHDVPAAVVQLASRSEFVTAYTPYQPEISQGVLQALFEFQTLVSRLAGLPVANASLYDGASALVEACNMAVGATGRQSLWISQGVNPNWRAVAKTAAEGTGHKIVEAPLSNGGTRWLDKGEEPAALVMAYPNYLGCLEDVAAARAKADELGALLVVAFDPVSAGLLVTPGEWGADVAVAEGQPLGMFLSFGGPYLGLFACKQELVRRMPGRLVGETVDVEGRRSYVTTLRAREQDIRREKASSNVCTNQTLMAVTAAIHLGWLGREGLRAVALQCARGARMCREALVAIEGVEPVSSLPTLREFALRTPVDARVLVERLADEGFLAGIPLGDGFEGSGLEGALLVAVTEKRTAAEIEAFVDAFAKALR
jgi:glycine dehydrogenase subunit 1